MSARHPHLRYKSVPTARIVALDPLAPLGYAEIEPPRFRVALYEAGTGAMISECRYRNAGEARRAYSRRVRALEGNRPERFRVFKALARQSVNSATRFGVCERERDRRLFLAQIGAVACDEIRAENPR